MPSDDTEDGVVNCTKEWQALFAKGDRIEAKNLLLDKIRTYKTEFHKIKSGIDPERRDRYLIFAVLFRGLLDYVELMDTFPENGWCKKPKCIEEAWRHLCDSKDRMRFVSRFYKNETVEGVIKSIEYIEQIIENKLGKGLYMSIDVTAEKELCSVCGNDTRSCSHIVGKIYDGNICMMIPQNLKERAVALVENPADPRCRIWPWNTRDEGDTLENECVVLTWFSVDDFMSED